LEEGFRDGNKTLLINFDEAERSPTDDTSEDNVNKGSKIVKEYNDNDQCTLQSSHATETEAEMLREITENDDNTSISDDSFAKLIELCDEESVVELIEHYGEESVSEDLRDVISPQFGRVQVMVNDSRPTTPIQVIADDSLSLLDDIPSPTCSLDSHLADSLNSGRGQLADSSCIPKVLNISYDCITPPKGLLSPPLTEKKSLDIVTDSSTGKKCPGSVRKSQLVRPSTKTLLKSTIEELLSISSVTKTNISSLPPELQFEEKKSGKSILHFSPQFEMPAKSGERRVQPIFHVAPPWSARKSKLIRPSTEDLLYLGRRRCQRQQFKKSSFTSRIPVFDKAS